MTAVISHTGEYKQSGEGKPSSGKPKFMKVYERGFDALSRISGNASALKVYLFIAEHAGHDNALVCTVETISECLGISDKTVRRATSFLQKGRHLVIAKVGTANAYILNPQEVWKTYEEHKHFCAFSAHTLVSKAQNKTLKRRLTHMMGTGDSEQQDFFDDEEATQN